MGYRQVEAEVVGQRMVQQLMPQRHLELGKNALKM